MRKANGGSNSSAKGRQNQQNQQQQQAQVDQFWKTKRCPFQANGNCTKGTSCTYAHDDSELRPEVDLRKTKLCPLWQRGFCNRGSSCNFAHGRHELRSTDDYYKSRICHFWLQGGCLAGESCRHAHGQQELRERKYKRSERDKLLAQALKMKLDLRGTKMTTGELRRFLGAPTADEEDLQYVLRSAPHVLSGARTLAEVEEEGSPIAVGVSGDSSTPTVLEGVSAKTGGRNGGVQTAAETKKQLARRRRGSRGKGGGVKAGGPVEELTLLSACPCVPAADMTPSAGRLRAEALPFEPLGCSAPAGIRPSSSSSPSSACGCEGVSISTSPSSRSLKFVETDGRGGARKGAPWGEVEKCEGDGEEPFLVWGDTEGDKREGEGVKEKKTTTQQNAFPPLEKEKAPAQKISAVPCPAETQKTQTKTLTAHATNETLSWAAVVRKGTLPLRPSSAVTVAPAAQQTSPVKKKSADNMMEMQLDSSQTQTMQQQSVESPSVVTVTTREGEGEGDCGDGGEGEGGAPSLPLSRRASSSLRTTPLLPPAQPEPQTALTALHSPSRGSALSVATLNGGGGLEGEVSRECSSASRRPPACGPPLVHVGDEQGIPSGGLEREYTVVRRTTSAVLERGRFEIPYPPDFLPACFASPSEDCLEEGEARASVSLPFPRTCSDQSAEGAEQQKETEGQTDCFPLLPTSGGCKEKGEGKMMKSLAVPLQTKASQHRGGGGESFAHKFWGPTPPPAPPGSPVVSPLSSTAAATSTTHRCSMPGTWAGVFSPPQMHLQTEGPRGSPNGCGVCEESPLGAPPVSPTDRFSLLHGDDSASPTATHTLSLAGEGELSPAFSFSAMHMRMQDGRGLGAVPSSSLWGPPESVWGGSAGGPLSISRGQAECGGPRGVSKHKPSPEEVATLNGWAAPNVSDSAVNRSTRVAAGTESGVGLKKVGGGVWSEKDPTNEMGVGKRGGLGADTCRSGSQSPPVRLPLVLSPASPVVSKCGEGVLLKAGEDEEDGVEDRMGDELLVSLREALFFSAAGEGEGGFDR
uniref:C3H1-type domain-containing protein n=1 Tax=Chromera velia CCMP2878 TaxID=1169474 RepID=A0A0G4IFF4_9ALVE|eukprot:Cvel_13961.t1-p1 / transcript=Cvel_13961.t1 / gene=Cvel_13961 / organism=Chromera_velia_CCMP2878 / gene_product=Zinc finger CCCH domain-containing protein 54, putative / transcript_product=Zinc finger CCCH domain-containing protein 54, putative / location=Cvel_scaffold975:27761-31269(-) / protein_length=1034 / sequence_SO=supercontig / SO=protein_coding / is_pseudo=false